MKTVFVSSLPIMVAEICVRFIGLHKKSLKRLVRIFDQDSEFYFAIDYKVATQLKEGEGYVLVYVPEYELNYATEVLFLGQKEQEADGFRIISYIDKGVIWKDILLLAYGHRGWKGAS